MKTFKELFESDINNKMVLLKANFRKFNQDKTIARRNAMKASNRKAYRKYKLAQNPLRDIKNSMREPFKVHL